MSVVTTDNPAVTVTGRELPPSMVERMTLILEVFESRNTRLTLEEVSRFTHLPRSTAHRILDQLVRLRWLAHTPFGYSLGSRTLELGGGGSGHFDVRSAAAPLLNELHARTGLLVHLAVLEEGEVLYLDRVGLGNPGVPSRIGGRAPAYATAVGKAMLAWMEPETVDTWYADGLPAQTGRTTTNLAQLHHELAKIRSRRGVAFERGEFHPEIACVGAAAAGPAGPIAGISLVGNPSRQLELIAPLVLNAARRLAAELLPSSGRSVARARGRVPHAAAFAERAAAGEATDGLDADGIWI